MKQPFVNATLEEVSTWGDTTYMDEGLLLTSDSTVLTHEKAAHRMNFILMGLCQKGTLNYSINTIKQEAKPGDLFFVSEGYIVDQVELSADCECLCIMVSTAFYHGFVQNVKNVSSLLLFSKNHPVVSLTEEETEVYTTYFDTIRQKMNNKRHIYRTETVKAMLLAMFYDMSGVIWRVGKENSKQQTRAEEIFAKFIMILEQNYRTERRVSWYAAQLSISPKYLSEMIRRASKRTPNSWIDSYVILDIRVMLKTTTKSIKDIARELNFPNQSFLGKYFRERVGMSPSDYRKHE